MADAVTLMLLDLGLDRRDHVSAPDTDRRGQAVHRDRRTEAAVQAETEARRARFAQAADSSDERARALSAWNNQSTFSRDDIAENQSNWLDGQGHRHQQGRNRSYDSHTEQLENQYGEERRMYLQERQARGTSNYTTAPGPALGGYSPSSGMPRSMSRRPLQAPRGLSERTLVPSPRPKPNRAPSPRRAGTVRFVGGQVVASRPASRVLQNQVATIRAAAASAAGRAAPRAASNPTQHAAPAAAPRAARAPQPRAAADRPASAAVVQPRQASTNGSGPPAQSAPNTSTSFSPHSGGGTATASNHTDVEQERYRALAEYWAARPGSQCDEYHANNPDRLQYLRKAQVKLVREACRRAKQPESDETKSYYETHKEHEWIFEGVRRAKEMIENESAAHVDEYYVKHPDEKDFCKAVRFYINDGFFGRSKEAVARPSNTPPDEAPAMQSSKPRTAAEPSAASKSNAAPTSRPAPKSSAAPRAAATPIREATASARSDPPRPSAAKAPSKASPEAPVKRKGALVATCLNAMGEELLKKRFEFAMPINGTVNLTVQDSVVNPQDLIDLVEGLATAMQGVTAVKKITPPPLRQEYDIHMGDDGLYDSD